MKNKITKILTVLLVFVLALSFAGCNKKDAVEAWCKENPERLQKREENWSEFFEGIGTVTLTGEGNKLIYNVHITDMLGHSDGTYVYAMRSAFGQYENIIEEMLVEAATMANVEDYSKVSVEVAFYRMDETWLCSYHSSTDEWTVDENVDVEAELQMRYNADGETFESVEAYVNAYKEKFTEATKNVAKPDGFELKIHANNNEFVMTYVYEKVLKTQDEREDIEIIYGRFMEENPNAFRNIVEALAISTNINPNDIHIKFRFTDADGTLIFEDYYYYE